MKKTFVMILLICIIVPLILGLLFGRNNSEANQSSDDIVQNAEEAAQSTDISTEDTAVPRKSITNGYVQLETSGRTYDGIPHWVNGYDGRVFADGAWFGAWAPENDPDLTAAMEEMPDIPFADDFIFKCVWEYDPDMLITETYTVFDESLNQLSYNEKALEIPPEKGTYYVAVNVIWGVKDNYSGYQYIFRIVRE